MNRKRQRALLSDLIEATLRHEKKIAISRDPERPIRGGRRRKGPSAAGQLIQIPGVGLGDRKERPFLETQYNETAPRFSPDGHWLAYASDESGRWEVYVQPYPRLGGKWQVSTEGGTEPAWNPTGRELFYRAGTRMMAVPVTFQPEFSAGKPVALFEGPWLPTPRTTPNYDVSRDGQRFLMLKSADEDQGAQQIVVVQNWLEELKQRMAAGKK